MFQNLRNQPGEKKFSDKEIEAKALEFLQPYLDKSVTELRMFDQHEKMHAFDNETVVFYRSYQGVPIFNQDYKVTIDIETGAVLGMFLSLTDGTETFADVSKVISPEAATRKYMKQNPLELKYAFPVVNDQIVREPVLTYTFEQEKATFIIDALKEG